MTPDTRYNDTVENPTKSERPFSVHMMHNQYTQRLLHIQLGFLLAFLLVFLAFTSWATWWSPALAVREDNPRVVEAELRLERGRILDANETVLAHSVPLPSGRFNREYPADVGEPVIGYYSLRHGTAGIENHLDEVLRGTAVGENNWEQAWRELTNQPQHGRDVRLTLRADWQAMADELLAGRQGALVLLSLNDNAVRVMASQPTYDPNLLNEQFDNLAAAENAPLLNRATQGRYQPGLILAPFIMAGAVNDGLLNLNLSAPTSAFVPIEVDGERLTCQADGSDLPASTTWGDVLRARCPAALVALADVGLTEERVTTYWNSFGLTQPPDVPLEVAEPEAVVLQDLTRALLGQEGLTITPLQMALAWSVLVRDGVLHPARLVSAVADEAGQWQGLSRESGRDKVVILPVTATAIREALPHFDRFIEYESAARSGPDEQSTVWYMALAPASSPRYALVLVLENERDTAVGRAIGREMLETVLE